MLNFKQKQKELCKCKNVCKLQMQNPTRQKKLIFAKFVDFQTQKTLIFKQFDFQGKKFDSC